MSHVVRIRVPLREGVPRPRRVALPAGDRLTERGEHVAIGGGRYPVVGWYDDYGQMHTVVRVGVK